MSSLLHTEPHSHLKRTSEPPPAQAPPRHDFRPRK
jgi:hypothetical protein